MSHGDADGLCSAVIAARAIGPDRVVWFSTEEPYIKKRISRDLELYKRIVVMDVALFDNLKTQGREILWIDHHPPPDNIPGQIVYVNPRLQNASAYVPASLQCYEFFKSHIKGDVTWIALIGVVADWGVDPNPGFILEAAEKYGLKERTQEDFKDSPFSRVGEMVNLGLKKGLGPKIFHRMVHGGFNEIASDKDLKLIYEEDEAAAESILSWHRENAIYHKEGKILGLLVKDYKNTSKIAQRLIGEYPGWTIIVAKPDDEDQDMIKVSLRQSNRTAKLNLLGKKALSGLSYRKFGGHPNASGGKIAAKDLPRFIENLGGLLKK